MNVTEAVMARISTRAFLPTPVPEETVREILHVARRSPSGGNVQPWKVFVVSGEARDALIKTVHAKVGAGIFGEGTEYHIYPPSLWDPYRARRYKCGEDMYAKMGIPRGDKPARLMHVARNYTFFDAPVGLFFFLERRMQNGQWSDLGMFMQTIMLLAQERGLATCAQEAWARWHKTVQDFFHVPEDYMLFSGMALGFADPDNPVNDLRTDREQVDEFATLLGFEKDQ